MRAAEINHWHLKMNRSVELSLSFQACDTQSNDNYSPDDSNCEERARHGEPCAATFKRTNEALPLMTDIMTPVSLSNLTSPRKEKNKTK